MIPENPMRVDTDSGRVCSMAWAEGYYALKKWLIEPCTEHQVEIQRYYDGSQLIAIGENYPHRYQCHLCMKELEVPK